MEKKNRKKEALMMTGFIQPSAVEMEKSVLGSLMISEDAYDLAASYLKAECFYQDANKTIFKAIESLKKSNRPSDILSVTEQLRATGELETVGGVYYVTQLTNSVFGLVEHHCRIVYQKFISREIIRISSELLNAAYQDSGDPFDLLDEAGNQIDNIRTKSFGDMVGIDSVLVQAMTKIEEWRHLDTSITGIPSGFKSLDKITRGWQPGDLVIIAARPSVGKTCFMLNLLKAAAKHFQDKKTAKVWSLEMKSLRLVLRMLAAESMELLERIQTGRLNQEQMKRLYVKGVQKLSGLKIFFDDTSGVNTRKIKAKAKKKTGGLDTGIIFLDYIQLTESEGKESIREQEVSKISRDLKKNSIGS